MAQIKSGTKVKVINNTCNHTYTIGKIYVTVRLNNGMWSLANPKTPSLVTGNNCYETDFKVIVETKEELLETNKKLDEQVLLLKEKIKFMTTHKFKEFDVKTFNSYKALEYMKDDSKSDLEKIEYFRTII